jgi:hypothetical protein
MTFEGALILILVIAPLIVSGAVIFVYSQSLLSLFLMLGGAIVGADLVLILGIHWLHLLARDWVEFQAVGFNFHTYHFAFVRLCWGSVWNCFSRNSIWLQQKQFTFYLVLHRFYLFYYHAKWVDSFCKRT